MTAAALTTASRPRSRRRRPSVVHAPQIQGDRRIGTTLTCTPGEWDGTYGLTYRWLRDGAAAGTASSLAVGTADAGKEFVCEVTAEGLTVAASGTVTVDSPIALTPPQIGGTPQLRGTLTCSRGVWDDTAAARYAVTYQWFKDDVAIAGATAPQLGPLTRADFEGRFTCEVTAEGLTAESTDELLVSAPEIVGDGPSPDGRAYVGRAITCDRGEWNDSEGLRYAVTYRWEREGFERPWTPIAGADDDTYVVQAGDVDWELRCIVTAEGEWSEESYSTYGEWPAVESTLTALDDSVIPGADNAYRLTLRNPNPINVFLQYAWLDLPDGFTYKPGQHDRLADRRPGGHEPQLPALAQRAVDRRERGADDRRRRQGQRDAGPLLRLRRRLRDQLHAVDQLLGGGDHLRRGAVRRGHVHDPRDRRRLTS